jgi:hypothetical protein
MQAAVIIFLGIFICVNKWVTEDSWALGKGHYQKFKKKKANKELWWQEFKKKI